MDVSGNPVIPPRYDDEGHFFNGLARVRVGRLWGFINEAGVMVVPPRFEDAGDFRATLAPVRVGKKWGYIDQNGQMRVKPNFQGAAAFRDGLARVESWDWIQCGNGVVYSNENAPDYVLHIQSDIRHNLVWRIDGRNYPCFPLKSRIGYIDQTGRFAIYPRFAEARDFSEGLAVVRVDSLGKFGFIDRRGVPVIEFQFDQAMDFSEGLAGVCVGRNSVNGVRDPGRWGFIDQTGKFVVRAQFAEISDFSEGLAAVSFWDRQGRGYIDKSGRLVIPAQYTEAEPFSEGLASVCQQVYSTFWRCNYIDKKATVIIDSVQAFGPFSGGLAIAYELNEAHVPKGPAVYIDMKGRVVALTEIETKRQ